MKTEVQRRGRKYRYVGVSSDCEGTFAVYVDLETGNYLTPDPDDRTRMCPAMWRGKWKTDLI